MFAPPGLSLQRLSAWVGDHDGVRTVHDLVRESALANPFQSLDVHAAAATCLVVHSENMPITSILDALKLHEENVLPCDQGILYSFRAFSNLCDTNVQVSTSKRFLVMGQWLDLALFQDHRSVQDIISCLEDQDEQNLIGSCLRVCFPLEAYKSLRDQFTKYRGSQIATSIVPPMLAASMLAQSDHDKRTIQLRLGEFITQIIFAQLEDYGSNYSLVKRQFISLSKLLEACIAKDMVSTGFRIMKWAIRQNRIRFPKDFDDIHSLNLAEYASFANNVKLIESHFYLRQEAIDAFRESISIDTKILQALASNLLIMPNGDTKSKKQYEFKVMRSTVISNIGSLSELLLHAEQYEEAMIYLTKLVDMESEASPSKRDEINKLSTDLYKLSYVHQILGTREPSKSKKRREHFKKACEYHESMLKCNRVLNNKKNNENLYREYSTLAALYKEIHDWSRAEKYYNLLLHEVRERGVQNISVDIARILQDFADVLLQRISLKQALHIMMMKQEFAKGTIDDLKYIANIHGRAVIQLQLWIDLLNRMLQENDVSTVSGNRGTRGEDFDDIDDNMSAGNSDVPESEYAGGVESKKNAPHTTSTTAAGMKEEYSAHRKSQDFDDEDIPVQPRNDDTEIAKQSDDEEEDEMDAAASNATSAAYDSSTVGSRTSSNMEIKEILDGVLKMPSTPEIDEYKDDIGPYVTKLLTYNTIQADFFARKAAEMESNQKEVAILIRKYELGVEQGVFNENQENFSLRAAQDHNQILYGIANLHLQLGEIPDALEKYRIALRKQILLGPPDDLFDKLIFVANLFVFHQKMDDSISMLETGLVACDRFYPDTISNHKGRLLFSLGLLEVQRNNFLRADEFFAKSLVVFNATGNREFQIEVLQKKFSNNRKSRQLQAIQDGDELLSRLINENDNKTRYVFEFNYCALLLDLNRFDEARVRHDGAFENFSRLVDVRSLEFLPAWENRVVVYLALNKYEDAESVARVALDILREHNQVTQFEFCCRRLVPILLERAARMLNANGNRLTPEIESLLDEVILETKKTWDVITPRSTTIAMVEFAASVLYSRGRGFYLKRLYEDAHDMYKIAYDSLYQICNGKMTHPLLEELMRAMDSTRDKIEDHDEEDEEDDEDYEEQDDEDDEDEDYEDEDEDDDDDVEEEEDEDDEEKDKEDKQSNTQQGLEESKIHTEVNRKKEPIEIVVRTSASAIVASQDGYTDDDQGSESSNDRHDKFTTTVASSNPSNHSKEQDAHPTTTTTTTTMATAATTTTTTTTTSKKKKKQSYLFSCFASPPQKKSTR